MSASATLTPLTYHAPPQRAERNQLMRLAEAIRAHPLIATLLDAQLEIAMILNENRQIVFANRALLQALDVTDAEAVLGQRPGEAVGCAYARALPGGCGTSEHCRVCGAVNAILDCLLRREHASGECQILINSPTGPATLELEVGATPLELEGHKCVVLAGRDVSPRRRRAALEQTFFHDVLNLTSGVQAILSLLQESGTDDASVHLERLEVMVRHLVDQIRAQRELAQAETGELSLHLEHVVARTVLEDVRSTYEYHPLAAGRTIHSLPPLPYDLALQTDRLLLARALGNLVKNALEASQARDEVTLSCEPVAGNRLVFSVHNPAVMPREIQLQIFRRSFSTKHAAGHSRGLGTFTAKLLVERYLDGQIDFTSDPQNGTTFYVRVPQGVAVAAAAQPAKRHEPLAGVQVLLAEDDAAMRRLLEVALRRVGATVTSTADGQAAFDAARKGPQPGARFDAVLLDLDMPRLTGYQAVCALRAARFDGPVLALSAREASTDAARCTAAGFTGYLEKPFDLETLIRTIRAHLPNCVRGR